MEKLKELQSQHINLDKFLFVWKETFFHTKSFMNKLTLRTGVLIINIINLMYATNKIVKTLDHLSFYNFFCSFLQGCALTAGSVLLLLSIETVDKAKSYWGYVLSAVSLYCLVFFGCLGLFRAESFFLDLFLLLIAIVIQLYFVWNDYCYAKLIAEGKQGHVETGREERLVETETHNNPSSNLEVINQL